jgi:hypothetical protein
VALLLSPRFAKVYVPASQTYAQLFPLAPHPVLDPLWSNDTTAIVLDGCEASRIDKARRIAGCELALASLRVCYENRAGAYNCGRCEKCLRTMLNLYIAGALARCPTFDRPLTPAAIVASACPPEGRSARAFLVENLQGLAQLGDRPDLLAALQQCLRGDEARRAYESRRLADLTLTELRAYGPRRLLRRVAAAVGRRARAAVARQRRSRSPARVRSRRRVQPMR